MNGVSHLLLPTCQPQKLARMNGQMVNDQFNIAHEIFYKRFHLKIIQQLETLTPWQKHLRT